jgi:hypothetical protein
MELPWFDLTYLPEKGIFRGEDYAFCEKAKAAGYSLHIDHDISKEVMHVGSFEFNPLHIPPSDGES